MAGRRESVDSTSYRKMRQRVVEIPEKKVSTIDTQCLQNKSTLSTSNPLGSLQVSS